ncbi:MAG: pyridoxal-phosphate dependent enzyme [Gemmatimonadota bacterium]
MNGSLRCPDCSLDLELTPRIYRCPTCLGPLCYSLPDRAFPTDHSGARPASMWRYLEALPQLRDPVSLGEFMTPLVPLQVGPHAALAKCEYTLPSGSYKDRGAALLISWLKEAGVEEAVEDSSGNAGAALAAYAARAGLRLKVFCPRTAAAGKLAQIGLYGAELVRVEGPRPRATAALLEYLETSGSVYASHLWQPLFLEGVRTLAYEIAEQLAWQAPECVVCPVGAGSVLLGLHWGFGDLLRAGRIDRLPRLVAVQAAGTAAVAAAWERGAGRVDPVAAPQPTIAEGIALPAPVRDRQVLEALRQSGGAAVTVSEAQIADGLLHLGRGGFCVEPTSAVVWHGLLEYLRPHPLPAESRIVLVLTGHGLKATGQVSDLLGSR